VYLKGASLWYATVLLKNIRLGWKGLPGANTLTYYNYCKLRLQFFMIMGLGDKVFEAYLFVVFAPDIISSSVVACTINISLL
jgi:hypothetical protein